MPLRATGRLPHALLLLAAAAAAATGLPLFQRNPADGRWFPASDLDVARRMVGHAPLEREEAGSVSATDRDFGVVLRSMEPHLPRNARILLLPAAPGDPAADWYQMRGSFLLAPRPVQLWRPDRKPDPRGLLGGSPVLLIAWRQPLPGGWKAVTTSGPAIVAAPLRPGSAGETPR